MATYIKFSLIFLLVGILLQFPSINARAQSAESTTIDSKSTSKPNSTKSEDTEKPKADEKKISETSEAVEPPETEKPSPTAASEKKEVKGTSKPFVVQWYRPEPSVSKKKRRATVIMSGISEPGSKVEINADKIPLIKNGRIYKIDKKNIVLDDSKAVVDWTGYFELEVLLPYYTVHLPIKVTSPSGEKKEFQFSFKVDKKEVELKTKNLKRSPYSRRKFGVWAGTGFNLLKYKQTTDDIPSGLELTTFKGPSFFAKGAWNLNDQWSTQATFNLSPGNASSSESVQVAEGGYNWLIFSAEATYFPKKWKSLFLGKYSSHLGVDFGLQQHMVPFMSRTGVSEQGTELVTNGLTMFTLGAQYIIDINRRWFFETFMRYQYPLSSGSVFDIKPKFAFDGSIGAVYKWMPQWRLGLFWYGQWHEYNFTHKDKYFELNPTLGPTTIRGEQSLFFSNIEVRLGFEFD